VSAWVENVMVRSTAVPSVFAALVVSVYVVPGSSRSVAVQVEPSPATSPLSAPAFDTSLTDEMVPPVAVTDTALSTGTPVAPFLTLVVSRSAGTGASELAATSLGPSLLASLPLLAPGAASPASQAVRAVSARAPMATTAAARERSRLSVMLRNSP